MAPLLDKSDPENPVSFVRTSDEEYLTNNPIS